jgi:hypothetical protein
MAKKSKTKKLKSKPQLKKTYQDKMEQHPQALLVIPDAGTLDMSPRIATLALENQIPVFQPIISSLVPAIWSAMAFRGATRTVIQLIL